MSQHLTDKEYEAIVGTNKFKRYFTIDGAPYYVIAATATGYIVKPKEENKTAMTFE